MEAQHDVYLDKIKLGWALIEKELDLVNQHTTLISNIKRGYIDKDRVTEYDAYRFTWQNLIELYRFLSHGYINIICKKDQEEIKGIVDRYLSMEGAEPTIQQLNRAVEIILLVMGRSGFHELIRKMDTLRGLDKIRRKYHTGDKEDE